LRSYAAYHADPRNKLAHCFGVPLVTFSIFLALGWLRFVHAPEAPCTGAVLFYLVVSLYYLRLDWRMALALAPFTLALLALADRAALWPFPQSLALFLGTFVGGWAIQLLGHALEGKRPALADNVLQIFNAPLFLAAEAAILLALRRDLRDALVPGPAPASSEGAAAPGPTEPPPTGAAASRSVDVPGAAGGPGG
jgi:uncharacterized membrane protein YGL010W